MTDKAFPAFAFLGLVLVLIPLPWHLQAWNAGTCLFMIWTAIGCLIHFVNAIVWDGNLGLHSAIWCDIATKLIVGLSVAVPCASLCINRRLYIIARVSQVHTTKAEKRRAVYIDIALGVGFPIIVMALHYIVQGHRFDIFEDIGCWPATVNMPPAYPLVWMWPIIIGLISMVYCALSLRALMKRRNEFNQLLAANKSLNVNRYFRLMALATIDIVATTPISIYFVYLNLTTSPPIPWVSLSDTHFNFSRIQYVPAFIVNSQPQLKLNFELNRWLFPACAILFFLFFGVAEEARRHYTKGYYAIVKRFGIMPPSRTVGGKSQKLISLPSNHGSIAGASSESGARWDSLSLKMPEIKEDAPPAFAANGAISIVDPRNNLKRAASFYSSSSSFTAGGPSNPPSPTQTLTPPVPALTITHPDSDAAYSPPSPTELMTSAPLNRELSRSSRQSYYRRSTSSDLQITISPAYFSETALQNEDAHSGLRQFNAYHGSETPLPRDGVRVTVEKSIV